MAVTSPNLTQRGTTPLSDTERIPQRMRALDRANDVRRLKTSVRTRLRTLDSAESAMEASRIFREMPDGTGVLEAGELMLAVFRLGKVKARPMLARWNASVWCPIGDLTERQRAGLAGELEDLSAGRLVHGRKVLHETSRLALCEIAATDEMGITAGDLAARIAVHPLGIGSLVRGLCCRGLVTRERLTSKKGLWLITAAGRREVERPPVIWGLR